MADDAVNLRVPVKALALGNTFGPLGFGHDRRVNDRKIVIDVGRYRLGTTIG